MDFISALLILMGVASVNAYFSFSKYIWAPALFITAILLLACHFISVTVFIIFILLIGLISAPAFLSEWRIKWLTTPLSKKIKKNMPVISATEQEAIDAGNVWWEKELFSGAPKWKNLFDFKLSQLTAEEQQFIDHPVEQLCAQLNDWHIVTQLKDLPPEIWQFMKQERFFGLVIPKEYGGLGFSAYAHSCIVIKIASRSISAAVTAMVPNSLGPAELILHYGTDAQKQTFLPRLASGEDIPCFALTSPFAGSDAGAIPDQGIVCRQVFNGIETLGMRVTWDKRYITLAPVASLLGLAIHLSDPEHLLSDKTELGITLCLIPTAHPGVEIGNRHIPLHLAFMNGTTRGKDVFIPLDWIIGGVTMAGQGWRMLMESLSVGRSVSLPALATACAKMTYRYTGAYAAIRQQFNVPIAQFEGIQAALTEIAGFTYLLDAARTLTVSAADQGIKPTITSAIIKYHLTEKARQAVNHAMDIHAGHAIQVGPRNFLAHAHLGIPVSITVEGANILTRNLIIFGQGAIRCHPFLLAEINELRRSPFDVRAFDGLLMQHASYLLRNKVRAFWHSLTRGYTVLVPGASPVVKRAVQVMTRMSAVLAYLSDVALIILGGSLKRKEHLSARLGDVLSELYLASAVVNYFKHHFEQPHDEPYVKWCVEYCMHRAEQAILKFCDNFPNRLIGWALKLVVFPGGAMHAYPKDDVGTALFSSMLHDSSLRNRLTKECFISTNKLETTCKLDQLFLLAPKYQFIRKQLHKLGLSKLNHQQLSELIAAPKNVEGISADDLQFLQEYEILYAEMIKVDEFSFDLKTELT